MLYEDLGGSRRLSRMNKGEFLTPLYSLIDNIRLSMYSLGLSVSLASFAFASGDIRMLTAHERLVVGRPALGR